MDGLRGAAQRVAAAMAGAEEQGGSLHKQLQHLVVQKVDEMQSGLTEQIQQVRGARGEGRVLDDLGEGQWGGTVG